MFSLMLILKIEEETDRVAKIDAYSASESPGHGAFSQDRDETLRGKLSGST